MPVTTFAAPILPGKTDAWQQATSEIRGARRADYQASRAALGIKQEIVSLQQTPDGDLAVVYIEADDPDTVIARMFASDSDFDKWFSETVLVGLHGMSVDSLPPTNAVSLRLVS